jgi:hypothetical protein
MKTGLGVCDMDFDMNFLDSGNENEAKLNFIGTLSRSNAESSLVLFYQV